MRDESSRLLLDQVAQGVNEARLKFVQISQGATSGPSIVVCSTVLIAPSQSGMCAKFLLSSTAFDRRVQGRIFKVRCAIRCDSDRVRCVSTTVTGVKAHLGTGC